MEYEEFVESLESLPIDLSRNLTLLRELDDKNVALKQDCLSIGDKYKNELDKLIKREHIQLLNELQQRRLQLADEKILLADQAYEMVEKHIRRLDDVLEHLNKEQQQQQANNKKKFIITIIEKQ